jgi:hypothetical protein
MLSLIIFKFSKNDAIFYALEYIMEYYFYA